MGNCGIKPSGLFGSSSFIKFSAGDLIAVDGPTVRERQLLNDLKIPYKQLLKSRIILKAGQQNYILNHLGLGDNATFLSIVARFDAKSKIETNNYLSFQYVTDITRTYYFSQLLQLTGNSTHRIPQLSLNNPNTTYAVTLEVMVAVIDDTYSFFDTSGAQYNLALSNLRYTDIQTWVADESIVIKDSAGNNVAFIQLSNINSLQRLANVIILDDQTVGNIYLEFIDIPNALQALSLLSYTQENPNVVIQDLTPINDAVDPIVTFTNNISLSNTPAPSPSPSPLPYPLNSGQSDIFYASDLALSNYGNVITKYILLTHIVNSTNDNRDGSIVLDSNNITIRDASNSIVDFIVTTGTYKIYFVLTDLAGNDLNTDKYIEINIV